jgi:hypothetical protein
MKSKHHLIMKILKNLEEEHLDDWIKVFHERKGEIDALFLEFQKESFI